MIVNICVSIASSSRATRIRPSRLGKPVRWRSTASTPYHPRVTCCGINIIYGHAACSFLPSDIFIWEMKNTGSV